MLKIQQTSPRASGLIKTSSAATKEEFSGNTHSTPMFSYVMFSWVVTSKQYKDGSKEENNNYRELIPWLLTPKPMCFKPC
jgi:ABC-type phosphate transport system substrate-binding protein